MSLIPCPDCAKPISHIAKACPYCGRPLFASLLDDPPPPVQFEGHSFCITGAFDFGMESEVKAAIESRGGAYIESISQKKLPGYLIIGAKGSPAHNPPFGSKGNKALEWKNRGIPIMVITETHWRSAL